MKLTEHQMLEIFKALSDQNRLQLFQLLMESDRTNSELMEETGLRQNLLSHHLNIMTECGLIWAHRSVGDARRHYYSPRLDTTSACRAWWVSNSPPASDDLPVLKHPRRVLFLCLRNGARSFMAEAIARHLASASLIPFSAGIDHDELPNVTIGKRVLDERNVPLVDFAPRTYHALEKLEFDVVITVCDIVHERELPAEFAHMPLIHWSLDDPLDLSDDDDERLNLMRSLFDEIVLRLSFFLQRLAMQEAA